MSRKIRLQEYAKIMTISRATALRWFHDGKIPYPTERPSERIILVTVPDDFSGLLPSKSDVSEGKTVAYTRVSTQKQKDGLKLQELSILQWANKNGITVDKCIGEIGSGFNENRLKLNKLLKDSSVSTIIVEHRDRLARSNFKLIESALHSQNRRIIVVNEGEEDEDFAREVTDFMVSAYGRLYGKRGADRVKKMMAEENAKNQ